jgi:hypothetical protein
MFFNSSCGHMVNMDSLVMRSSLVLVARPQVIGRDDIRDSPFVCLTGSDDGGEHDFSMTEWRFTADGFRIWTSGSEDNPHRLSRTPAPEYRVYGWEAIVVAVSLEAAVHFLLHTEKFEEEASLFESICYEVMALPDRPADFR